MAASDADLLARWRRGDKRTGSILVERYYDAVECFFLNKVGGTSIRDLVQDTFIACVESRDRITDPEKFRSYLFSIAYNVLHSHFRRKQRDSGALAIDETAMHDLSPGPCSLLVKRAEQRLLLEALRRIPSSDQVLLELHYWENVSTSDMAEILNIPRGTVKRRMFTARQRLDKMLAQLADSPELLDSTLVNLEQWARQCRRDMGRHSSAIDSPSA